MFLPKYSLSLLCTHPDGVSGARQQKQREDQRGDSMTESLGARLSGGSMEADDWFNSLRFYATTHMAQYCGCCYPQCHLMPECCVGVGEGAGHGHAHSDACRERETTQHPITRQLSIRCLFSSLSGYRQGQAKLLTGGTRLVLKKEQINGVCW